MLKRKYIISLILVFETIVIVLGGSCYYRSEKQRLLEIANDCFTMAIKKDIDINRPPAVFSYSGNKESASDSIKIATATGEKMFEKKKDLCSIDKKDKIDYVLQLYIYNKRPERAIEIDSIFRKILQERDLFVLTSVSYFKGEDVKQISDSAVTKSGVELFPFVYKVGNPELDIKISAYVVFPLSVFIKHFSLLWVLLMTWFAITVGVLYVFCFKPKVQKKSVESVNNASTDSSSSNWIELRHRLLYNVKTGEMKDDTHSVKLTPKSSSLFIALLNATGNFISYEELMQKGNDMSFLEKGQINKAFSRLRGELKLFPGMIIEALHSKGYKLIIEPNAHLF